MTSADAQLAHTVKPEGIWENVFSYHPYDVSLERAEGVYLYDQDGKQYFDVSGGPMAVNLPHSDPRMIEMLTEQIQRYAYCHPTLASPERAVVAFTGDAGLEMILGELATLRDLKLPVIVVVFVDASLARMAGRGRVLIRMSGTEPLIRVMVEAETDAEAQMEADGLAAAVESLFC